MTCPEGYGNYDFPGFFAFVYPTSSVSGFEYRMMGNSGSGHDVWASREGYMQRRDLVVLPRGWYLAGGGKERVTPCEYLPRNEGVVIQSFCLWYLSVRQGWQVRYSRMTIG